MSESLEQRALQLAKRFHDIYEELAPKFGYETRKDTRVFRAESDNGKLMIAVCTRLTAEQGEPVAWLEPDGTLTACTPEDYPFERCIANGCTPLYTSPPSDALDAKRYRWLREGSHAMVVAKNFTFAPAYFKRENELDAAIDAAMEKSHE